MIDVYLAGPYTAESDETKLLRYQELTRVAADLSAKGIAVFSPITHSVPMEEKCGGLWEHWAEIDRKFIAASREVWVYCLAGWEVSRGVTAELEIALEMGKPVRLLPPGGSISERVLEVVVGDYLRRSMG